MAWFGRSITCAKSVSFAWSYAGHVSRAHAAARSCPQNNVIPPEAWTPKGETSSSLTHTAAESVSLCVPMKSLLLLVELESAIRVYEVD